MSTYFLLPLVTTVGNLLRIAYYDKLCQLHIRRLTKTQLISDL